MAAAQGDDAEGQQTGGEGARPGGQTTTRWPTRIVPRCTRPVAVRPMKSS